ncbi:FAD-dependent thymidylate synthase [Tissierella praeacuta]|uniref:FAD-dependent thymidylate synthase n=1 Tax=Tissierella praeacuta TaxID=43131 RepID=UPI000ED1D4CC|nr:FAD-dependent thymidylate synthase [Tissierella praeacuta]MBU5256369.1 FAD-dependent thymidylate synthase [Tissierella praeacuta]HAE92345.1 FAD-dependent thymidylate synthase [Tissierella sp.]
MVKVELLRYTPDGEKLIAAAARLCYSSIGVNEIEESLNEEKVESFLSLLMDLNHESPIEHVTFTFGVEGVSRTLTHQLVRHRIASFSQQSQRYVKLEQFEYIIPPAIANNKRAREIFENAMKEDQKNYNEISNLLFNEYYNKYINLNYNEKEARNKAEKESIEDARYIFPNACETKIVFTMNARSLMNFFKLRCCNRAQWEIRELAILMLIEVKKIYPTLFKNAGPGCINGPCPEGKMTCGKISEVREKFMT